MTGTRLPKRLMVSPNVETRWGRAEPSMLILHYTGMATSERACSWLCAPEAKVSCHYLVDDDGGIVQMADEDLRAWHAGVSKWQGQTDINSHSIGIEIQNPGHTMGYPEFPATQMKAVAALCRDIIERHGIEPQRVLAHSDVAPGRKIDPGEKFNWKFLHEQGVGHWREPSTIVGGVLMRGDEGELVSELQQMLQSYGYGIESNGVFDLHTHHVVAAFQRHFRQAKVDGVADASTVDTLRRLLPA